MYPIKILHEKQSTSIVKETDKRGFGFKCITCYLELL